MIKITIEVTEQELKKLLEAMKRRMLAIYADIDYADERDKMCAKVLKAAGLFESK